MTALSIHLQPAPYQYGLLTLRLFGKLGGKNRRFLRELSDVVSAEETQDDEPVLSVEYFWDNSQPTALKMHQQEDSSGEVQPHQSPTKHSLQLPLDRAVQTLKIIAL